MSEVRLVVREAGRDWSGNVHYSDADRAIAALSADPVSFEELAVAYTRFEKPGPGGRPLANLRPGLNDEPWDGGLVVLDLAARLVYTATNCFTPLPSGGVEYHNGLCATDRLLPFHLADDWLLVGDLPEWRGLAEDRRRERGDDPPLDFRSILYGRPLLEFLVREVLASLQRPEEPLAADNVAGESIRAIHAAWLLTPRDDLRGGCPRSVAYAGHRQVVWDLQDQSERWSVLNEPPPALAETSHAFRYAGVGTHEWVEYYELVRHLLWSCHDALAERRTASPESFRMLSTGDVLTTEVPRLEQVREAWLDAPDPEFHGRTPRAIIHRERIRLPEAISGHEAMVDPDCPCCQMMADMPGPCFWGLDGCNLDDDFAFDFGCATRAEWDEKQRKYAEWDRRFKAQSAERERLGVEDGSEDAIWKRSFFVADLGDLPLGVRLFGVGCRLAEVIAELRSAGSAETPAAVEAEIDDLNRHFGNLREILQSDDVARATALLEPVQARFADCLASVAAGHPPLAARCAELAETLARLLQASNSSYPEMREDDVPF